MQQGVADRPEDQTGEPTAASGTDDHELGAVGLLEQDVRWAVIGDQPFDRDVGVPVGPGSRSDSSFRSRPSIASRSSSGSHAGLAMRSRQVCTATNRTPRAAAASNANAIAASLVGESSTPTTTGRVAVDDGSRSAPRTTTTGQAACAARATATEPASSPSIRPRPLLPITTS